MLRAIVVLTLPLAVVLSVLAWSSAGTAEPLAPSPIVAASSDSTELSQALHSISGSMSCASQGCHGRLEPLSSKPVFQNESTAWLNRDPHANAYEVLKSDRSKKIAENLNGPGKPAHRDARCLACHAHPEVARLAAEQQAEIWNSEKLADQFDHAAVKGTGVGCESCHTSAGHATSEYLKEHVNWGPTGRTDGTWKLDSNLEMWARAGLAPLTRLEVQADLCASCHVGSPGSAIEPIRDCNHDIMAAGHPRLLYEAATYQLRLPPHWNQKQYPELDGRMASMFVVGQSVAAQHAVGLSALHAQNASVVWPEFSDMDCFSCHSGLRPSADSWKQKRLFPTMRAAGLAPGTQIACSWTLSMAPELSSRPAMRQKIDAWSKAVSGTRPNAVAATAKSLLSELSEWRSETAKSAQLNQESRRALLRKIAPVAVEALKNGRWDESRHAVMALFWLSRGDPSLGSDGGAALFGPALSALEFSTGSDSPAQFRQGMDAEGLARLAVWAESLARR